MNDPDSLPPLVPEESPDASKGDSHEPFVDEPDFGVQQGFDDAQEMVTWSVDNLPEDTRLGGEPDLIPPAPLPDPSPEIAETFSPPDEGPLILQRGSELDQARWSLDLSKAERRYEVMRDGAASDNVLDAVNHMLEARDLESPDLGDAYVEHVAQETGTSHPSYEVLGTWDRRTGEVSGPPVVDDPLPVDLTSTTDVPPGSDPA